MGADDEQALREAAWIGDAVLALFARERILADPSIKPGERSAHFSRLTSNEFLASFGPPTAIEAEIGRLYRSEGLERAFRHIEEQLMPLHRKQEANRRPSRR